MDTPEKESRWIYCPVCHGKTRTKVYEDTALVHFPLYCPKCKKEVRINAINWKMTIDTEPDA